MGIRGIRKTKNRFLWITGLCLVISWSYAIAQEDPPAGNRYARTVCLGCHEDIDDDMSARAHRAVKNDCVRCHGDSEEHIHSEGEIIGSDLETFVHAYEEAAAQSDICLDCHTDSHRQHWPGSVHEGEDLTCISCHSIHREDRVLEQDQQADVCYDCHQNVRADMLKPYRHPLPEGKMACSDCHQPHGSAGPASLQGFTVTESCTDCHGEKRGPYLWEHFPVSEDCTLCHKAHGSIHPGLLTKRKPHLCQSCHQPTAEFAARHARKPLAYREPGLAADAVNRLVLGESCTHCHVQVHGSNHPSGARFMR